MNLFDKFLHKAAGVQTQGLKAGGGQQGGYRPPMAWRARVTTGDWDWPQFLPTR